jgi:5-methylcytosine-specific restriction protein A
MGVKRRWHRPSDAVQRSPRWPALRLAALRRDDFKCVQCGARGRLEVDHKVPVRSAPEMAFELGNLQALCRSCHSKKTRLEMGFPALSEARQQWRNSVRALMRDGHHDHKQYEASHVAVDQNSAPSV